MKKSQWEAYWNELKKQIDKDPLPGVLGLDLIRGKPLPTQDVLNRHPLQILGKAAFLRNMLQQILEWDLNREASLIFIAPEEGSGLLEEVNYVFKNAGEKPDSFLFYSRLRPKLSVSSLNFPDIFRLNKHLYMELGKEGDSLGDVLFSLEKEIKGNPFIYFFAPERLERHCIIDYAKRLKKNVSLRIFSESIQCLSHEEASLIYGPELYPLETYEKMRKHCYRAFEERRKWSEKNEFFGPSETREQLKLAKESAKAVPLAQTAFARFKLWNEKGENYYWFYPVRQSLGRMPCEPPPRPSQVEKKPTPRKGVPGVDPADYDPRVIDIIQDLRPKNQEPPKEVC